MIEERETGSGFILRTYINAAGQMIASDHYFDFTGMTYSTDPEIGTINENFYRTQFSYDSRGRQNRTVNAVGTITRTVFDGLGRQASIWVPDQPDAELLRAKSTREFDDQGRVFSFEARGHPALKALRMFDPFSQPKPLLEKSPRGLLTGIYTSVHLPLVLGNFPVSRPLG